MVKGKVTYDLEGEVRRLTAEVRDLERKILILRHSRRVLIDVMTLREQRYRLALQQVTASRRKSRRHQSDNH